ncbi:FecR family protein [Parapedobacter tibetensis]|uniref:FecR family protein n=1 Tax=Parapedobacter tibetensis TaxID=2972951 RepID=UPI00214D62DD|nr:FecR family protein [Parapedobacter tibetensis]
MDKDQINRLLTRYLAGECTAEEHALLERWYQQLEPSPSSAPIPEEEVRADVEEIRNQLLPRNKRLRIGWIPKTFAAAALLLAIVWYGRPYLDQMDSSIASTQTVLLDAADIYPGGDKATLTLADGRQLVLENADSGMIASQAGGQIYKNDEGTLSYRLGAGDTSIAPSYHTISTPRGGQYKLRLPDGTLVWLNASSSVTYAANVFTEDRTVKLQGEAYFDVAQDRHHPFKVITESQEAEVLGTQFNINSYNDEPSTKTTLIEGSVQLTSLGSMKPIVLKPNQQATVNAGNAITISQVDVADAIAWKNGLFRFNNSDIEVVMRQIARWYDVTVVFEGEKPTMKLWGEVYRHDNAAKAMEMLSYFGLKYRIEMKGDEKRIAILAKD